MADGTGSAGSSDGLDREMASLLAPVLDQHPLGLALLDRDLRFRWVNDRFASIAGVSPLGHRGRGVEEMLPWLESPVLGTLRTVLEGDAPAEDVELDCPPRAASGAATWHLRFEAVRDGFGTLAGLAVTAHDVTRAHLDRAALDQERADSAVMAAITRDVLGETGPDRIAQIVLDVAVGSLSSPAGAVYLLDPEGECLHLVASSGLPEGLDARLAELPMGSPEPDSVGAIARSGELLVVRSGSSGAEPHDQGAGLLGRPFEVLVPLRTPDGPIGAFVIGLDLEPPPEMIARIRTYANVASASVARARASVSDRRARALLETIVDQMPLGVAVTGPVGDLESMNRALQTIWRGRRASASIAEYAEWRGFHPDGRSYAAEEWPLARSITEREVVVAEEIAIERLDGSRGVIALSSSPVTDAEGSLVAAVAVVEDVSERRHAEAAREAFLGVLAHELRTPLTTILGASRVLQRTGQSPDLVAELAADIAGDAERMARVIDDLLVVSRVERGLALAIDAPVLVQRILPGVVAAEQRSWPSVQFDLKIASWLPPVGGDDALLGQVVRNLLSNAAKYGGGHVQVQAEPTRDGVAVIVSDDGPGIQGDEAARIFDLFFRSSRTQRVAPGAGIGLFVVRHLVGAMGGDVIAEPGDTGARFVVRLRAYGGRDGQVDRA
jgi:PAS domain S-box-containing protein